MENAEKEVTEFEFNEETNHLYLDLDKIRLVVEDDEIVAWYAPNGIEEMV